MRKNYKFKTEPWQVIYSGLPEIITTDRDTAPVPEMLRVIEYCIDDRVELFDIAQVLAKKIIKINENIHTLNWYASVCFDAKKYVDCYETCKKILPYVSEDFYFYLNMAKSANRCNLVDDAIYYTEKALSIKTISEKERNMALIDFVVYYSNRGDIDKSNEIFESIDTSEFDEQEKMIHEYNGGCYYLKKHRDFKKGMKALCSGRKFNVWGHNQKDKFKKPAWNGKSYPGKTILIVGEAGLGDEIISWRFAKIIKERGMNVIYSTTRDGNVSVAKRIPEFDNVYKEDVVKNLNVYDYWVPCMDLPMVLGLEESDVPNDPYLTADKKYIEKWSEIIPKKEGRFRVGIRWAGNALYEEELLRTIPIEKFDELVANAPDNIDFYSLQRDDGTENYYKMKNFSKVKPLHDELDSLEDALGAMANLDLVITSCTSIAHMSAAMGIPTWIGTVQLPYYVWLCKDDTWYKNVKLYRKPIYNDWDTPFNQIQKDLVTFINKLEKEEKN